MKKTLTILGALGLLALPFLSAACSSSHPKDTAPISSTPANTPNMDTQSSATTEPTTEPTAMNSDANLGASSAGRGR